MAKQGQLITVAQAEEIKKQMYDGYHNQKLDDYPPYALTPWDDRQRFCKYIERVLMRLSS